MIADFTIQGDDSSLSQVKEEGAEDTHVYGKFTYWCEETTKEKNKLIKESKETIDVSTSTIEVHNLQTVNDASFWYILVNFVAKNVKFVRDSIKILLQCFA